MQYVNEIIKRMFCWVCLYISIVTSRILQNEISNSKALAIFCVAHLIEASRTFNLFVLLFHIAFVVDLLNLVRLPRMEHYFPQSKII